MIGVKLQRVYRQLLLSPETTQKKLAEKCGCSIAFVSKVVERLKKKKIAHQPLRNRIAVLRLADLLMLWAFTRDIEDEKTMRMQTSMATPELEKWVRQKGGVLTGLSAAKHYKALETPYEEVFAYGKNLKPPHGSRAVLCVLPQDEHLQKTASQGFAPEAQVFADLVSINTWEAKYAALSLAKKTLGFPLFGTYEEIMEIMT